MIVSLSGQFKERSGGIYRRQILETSLLGLVEVMIHQSSPEVIQILSVISPIVHRASRNKR